MTLPEITVVGLGPADSSFLTAAAHQVLTATGPVGPLYVRTERHPAAEPLVAGGAATFDHHYEAAETFEDAYRAIVEELVEAAGRHGRVRYAVPGSPVVLEHTVDLLRADPRVTVRIVPGLSFLDLAWERLGIDPVDEGVRMVDAERFLEQAAGEQGPLLVSQTWSAGLLSDVKLAFEEPPSVEVVILHHLGLPDERVVSVPFSELDRTLVPDHLTCCYLPEVGRSVAEELVRADEVVRLLRVECPWDSEQSHQSLVRHLLEESYEAIEAIEELGDEPGPDAIGHLQEELGDVLCQVLFHATIASEQGWFNLADVAGGLADKLVARHPHVFGDDPSRSPSADEVLGQWEARKRVEKGRTSALDGIPAALPALALAAKLERRAAEAGSPIASSTEVLGTISAALEQLAAGSTASVGEALFALARLTVRAGAEPEELLRSAMRDWASRFRATEAEGRDGAGPDVTA